MAEISKRGSRSTHGLDDVILETSESDLKAIRNETAELMDNFVRLFSYLSFHFHIGEYHCNLLLLLYGYIYCSLLSSRIHSRRKLHSNRGSGRGVCSCGLNKIAETFLKYIPPLRCRKPFEILLVIPKTFYSI